MRARPGVVLEMIAVIEEEEVVKAAVVAGRAAGMLVAALQPAEAEADEITGDVSGEEQTRGECGNENPKREHPHRLNQQLAAQFQFPFPPGVMGEMTRAPQGLRDAKDEAEIE